MRLFIRNRAIDFRLFNGKFVLQNAGLTGFILIELLVVFFIIGVLAAIALPLFKTARERALDKEAESILKLMRTAENAYHMERGVYLNCANINAINTNLRLDIAPGSPNWNYRITNAAANDFICKARRSADNFRVWCLRRASAAPYRCAW